MQYLARADRQKDFGFETADGSYRFEVYRDIMLPAYFGGRGTTPGEVEVLDRDGRVLDSEIGVQVIQTFGIRVHLLGITAIDGEHQSRLLVRESDPVAAWSVDVVRKFMSQREVTATVAGLVGAAGEAPASDQSDEASLRAAVVAFYQTLEPSDIEDIETVFNASRQIPPTYDGRLLASCRTALGRDLLVHERRQFRSLFN